jgi:hypothetical protein
MPFAGEGYLSGSEAYGGDGDDTLQGVVDYTYDMGKAKILSGGAGDDLIYAKGGEQVDAGAGNDTVFAFTASYAETTNVTLGDGARRHDGPAELRCTGLLGLADHATRNADGGVDAVAHNASLHTRQGTVSPSRRLRALKA